MQEILKRALLILFQHYPLETKDGENRYLSRQNIKIFLIDVLQKVAPLFSIHGPTCSDGKIKYREPAFLQAIEEVLSEDPHDSKRLQVKQQYLSVVWGGLRPSWYGRKFKDIRQEAVRRVVMVFQEGGSTA